VDEECAPVVAGRFRLSEVLTDCNPELGRRRPLLGASTLDEALVIVGVDDCGDRDSLLDPIIATVPQRLEHTGFSQT